LRNASREGHSEVQQWVEAYGCTEE
jgi:hypothetical protein